MQRRVGVLDRLMAFIKGILCGLLAAFIISFFMSRAGYPPGGVLALHREAIAGYSFVWSWPIFIAIGALAFGIFKMME